MQTEDTGLSTRLEQTYELSPTGAAAEKQHEIQSAIIIAKRFQRNEAAAFEKLRKSAERPSFADDSYYSFKRGKKQNDKGEWVENTVEGPSVHLMREAARVWGNIRYGTDIVRDDDDARLIRSWAWDLETNAHVSQETAFSKLVQRKVYENGRSQGTKWVKPDERDLRELTNKQAAIGERNCLGKVLPEDMVQDALAVCKETEARYAVNDPVKAREKIIRAFSQINISAEMLEQKLGHLLAQCTADEIVELRGIYKSIADGNSSWAEYMEPRERREPESGKLSMADMKPAVDEKPKGEQQRSRSKARADGGNPDYSEGADPDPGPAARQPGEEG